MRKFFSENNPLSKILETLYNLVILNLLTVLCCLPIITAGASLTAAYTVVHAMRNGENTVVKPFFTAFRKNIKQATILWMLWVLCFVVVLVCGNICAQVGTEIFRIFRFIMIIESLFLILLLTWLIPMQARFSSPIVDTMRNSLLLTLSHCWEAIIMTVLYLVPIVLLLLTPSLFPIIIFINLSVPMFLCEWICNRILGIIENNFKMEKSEK